MPNLPHESAPGAEDLRAYLEGILPGSQLTNATVNASYQPLLLLQTTNVMAAFAFSNGDMPKTYSSLYDSFKKYYAEQRGKWDALDLAFVFCVRPDIPDLERFCSNIETDVYFCRKFVIPLVQPLGEALARLPFLPLIPLHGQPFRPPSAQTLLQQSGVPADLARYLVIQRERGPERIVEDCIGGTFGEPRELTPALNAPVARADRAPAPVQLETVVITNFRAYRKPQPFAVGAAVTVLYGPNGFGKTSFFDAIDFAVTGDIGRIKSSSDAHFKKTAKHLDSKSEESVVSLSFVSQGTVRELTRTVNDRKQALLDGRSTERKTILAELTGGDAPGTDRVENFVSLFRATHLFSQEHQELAKGFEDDCQISGQIVSRMLAFEDYANAVNKATKVRELVEIAIANAEEEIRELSTQIGEEQKELDRLSQTAQAHTNTGALDVEIEILRVKLVQAGIPMSPGQPDATVVRGWRATLEARYAESQSRTTRLSLLAKEAANLPRMLAELAGLQQQLATNEQILSATDEKRTAAEMEHQLAARQLAEITAIREEAQTRAALLEWIRTTKPSYAQILQRHGEITEELSRATSALEQHRASEEKALGDLRTHEHLAAQAGEKLAAKRAEFLALQTLNSTIPEWRANQARLAAVIEAEQASLHSSESLRAEEGQLSPQVVTMGAEEARLSRQIAEVDQNQSELKRLLSQMQGHVLDGICPLCGEDHGSKDELIRRIHKHIDADAASGTRIELTGVQERIRQLTGWVADNKEKRQAVEAQIGTLKSERAKVTKEIGRFENSIAEFGIVIDAAPPIPEEQLHIRQARAQEEIADLVRQVQESGDGLQAARTVLADVRAFVVASTAEVTDKESVLTRLQEDASRLRKDPRLIQVSLDIEATQLAQLELLNSQDLAGFNAEATKAERDEVQKRLQVSALREELASLRVQLATLHTQVANIQRTVTQITARLGESKLPPDVSENTLLASIAEESRVQAHFLSLRDSAASIELAIDAATTSAALTQLLQNVRNKERTVATATQKRDQHQPWLKYFDGLSRLMSSQQSQAIANFTRDYGPRTSVIQRRLRSVYGFDEIEIQSHESTVSVRVKRHGEELRPTDYFSQSQQQTLLLSLFLTACLSQTWSALSTVFLDDPVTHFDDLNTYAFLDLIVGLLKSDSGQRQFVMSTCDEKFLQLARQKFRHLGARAKFYTFSAIGADGPVINESAPT
ncbi:MAG TPA: AAA family ATPase [Candidatus Acidoferrales bacterium]|nr:AAA family ATPase [Candidatus Acidoferrales bacterium]